MTNRELLPQRRASENYQLTFAGFAHGAFTVTTGRYGDGRIGEIFINGAKSGTELESVCRDAAVLLSLALQHGVPIAVMAGAVTRDLSGAPMSIVGAVLDTLDASGRAQTQTDANASRETGAP